MDKVFLENFYELLLLFHLLITFILIGSMTHNLTIVYGYLRGRFGRKVRELYYARVSFWSYMIVYIIGALIYPYFRIYIRHDYLDAHLPWATGLFEVKEHWGAIGVGLLACYYLLRKMFDPEHEKEKLYFYIPLCFLLNLILWYKIVVGCYLTILKGS
jgi:hypothetical protein